MNGEGYGVGCFVGGWLENRQGWWVVSAVMYVLFWMV